MRKLLALLFLFNIYSVYGQLPTQKGQVSYITSSSIYVRFDNTGSIKIGDTLTVNNSPCLVVTNKSSTSCVCKKMGTCNIEKGSVVEARLVSTPENLNKAAVLLDTADTTVQKKRLLHQVNGRVSVAGLSNMSAQRNNSYRTVYGVSLRANHINESKFSFEANMNYTQNFNESSIADTRKRDYLNVYSLALKYDIDSSFLLVVGRRINRKMTSIGATDGLHFEKRFGRMFAGVIVGFRPDVFNFSISSDLFQYGGYIGFNSKSKLHTSETTLGFIEQFNTGNVDRRYGYIQHSSRFGRKLSLYSSAEIDLYNYVDTNTTTSSPRLTNLFMSANYRFNKFVRLYVSYNARKRILFHESYPTLIREIIVNDETRQGLRLRLHVKPYKYLSVGAGLNVRFQNNTQNKSNNINIYATYRKIPKIGGRIRLNYNLNNSNYFNLNIGSIRYSRRFLKEKLSSEWYYRFAHYRYILNELDRNQSYLGTSVAYRITLKLMVTVLGEVSMLESENMYRLNFRIVQRF